MAKKTTEVFHISPKENIKFLRPVGGHSGTQSIKMKQAGVYVAPSFKDSVMWGLSYVIHKRNPTRYRRLTIYRLLVPKKVLKRAWQASWWEPEYFIPEKDMKHLKIISKQSYSFDELLKLESRWRRRNHDAQAGRNRFDKAKYNLAAKEMVRLNAVYADLMLAGYRQNIWHERVIGKIGELRPFIFKDYMRIELNDTKLSPDQEKKVRAIVASVELLLDKIRKTKPSGSRAME